MTKDGMTPPQDQQQRQDVCSPYSHSSNIVLALVSVIRQKNEIKHIKIEKEETKPSLICRWQEDLHRKSQGFYQKK